MTNFWFGFASGGLFLAMFIVVFVMLKKNQTDRNSEKFLAINNETLQIMRERVVEERRLADTLVLLVANTSTLLNLTAPIQDTDRPLCHVSDCKKAVCFACDQNHCGQYKKEVGCNG